jgi:hypothetical protein
MLDTIALVKELLLERPMCEICLRERCVVSITEVRSALTKLEVSTPLKRGVDRCRACGNRSEVVWVPRGGSPR